ncbi:50S ribosomal protein L17 [Marinoscillum pacificum]|uniref:50S ribosomal protein L17 n=1 Tax=Marinoscillum pacificum TaxID=392723 RepID=UPI002157B9E4|nr:50S ribosomal protein L17 [Marinoscillum pacificum]
MRHGKKFNHLGRTASHRNAMLSNMASSLILHKRINTTVAKAKALRKYVEPLITRAKDDTTHSRRMAFSYLQDKESVTELFGPIAEKVAARPGGYTRIIKTGIRLGDNAEMCMVELVDFNELLLQDSDASKAKTRRSRRGGKKQEVTAEAAPKAEAAVEEAKVVEESAKEEAPKAEETGETEDDSKKGE